MLKKHGGTVICQKNLMLWYMIKAIQFHGACPKIWYYQSTSKNMEVLWDIFLFENKTCWYEIKVFDTQRKLFVSSPERRTDKTSHGELQSAAAAQMWRRVAGMFTTCLHGSMKGGRTKIAVPLILFPHPHACMCCVSESLEIRGSDSSRLQIFQLKGTAHFPSN